MSGMSAKAPHLSESWRTFTRRWLDKELCPLIGALANGSTSRPRHPVSHSLKSIEARGIPRHSVLCAAAGVTGLSARDPQPTSGLRPRTELEGRPDHASPVQHRAPLATRDIPAFIEALDAYRGTLQTKLAIKLLLLTFVRKLGVSASGVE